VHNEGGKATAFTKGGYPSKIKAIDEKESEPLHVQMTFDSDAVCSGLVTDKKYKTIFEVFCDPDGNEDVQPEDKDFKVEKDSDKCEVRISVKHNSGCQVIPTTAIVNFFKKYPALLAVFLIGFGIAANFFGGKIFPYVIAILGGGFTFLVTLLLSSVFGGLDALDRDPSVGNVFLAIFCFLIAGGLSAGIAFLCWKYVKFGPTILGVFGGFSLGFYLYNITFAFFVNSQIFRLIVIAALAIGCGIYAYIYSETLTVPLTSIIGSYCLVRGASLFIGHFPGSFFSLSKENSFFQMATLYYLLAFIFLLVIGVQFQKYMRFDKIYDSFYVAEYEEPLDPKKDDDYKNATAIQ